MIAPVVSAAWTAEHLDEVVLADVRWYLDGSPGRAAYEAGHLPGAVFVELDEWLAAHGSPERGRHPLPSGSTREASRRRHHALTSRGSACHTSGSSR